MSRLSWIILLFLIVVAIVFCALPWDKKKREEELKKQFRDKVHRRNRLRDYVKLLQIKKRRADRKYQWQTLGYASMAFLIVSAFAVYGVLAYLNASPLVFAIMITVMTVLCAGLPYFSKYSLEQLKLVEVQGRIRNNVYGRHQNIDELIINGKQEIAVIDCELDELLENDLLN